MADAKPSDLIAAFEDYGPAIEMATDTETSGLFADDGARVSTASIAWEDNNPNWREWCERWDNVTYGEEVIVDLGGGEQITANIISIAWPFDQGTEGKEEDDGQAKLWPDAENLDESEWLDLLDILSSHDLIMHNGPFDVEKYRVGVRRWPGIGVELIDHLVWDTQNVNDMLWRLEPTSLKPTCARLFGQEWADEAGVVKKYLAKAKLPAGRWDLIPWEVISKYADTDARITLMLKMRQVWEIADNNAGFWLGHDVFGFVERRLEVSKILYRMTRRGVPYDQVASREAAIECRERAERVAGGLPFRPTGTEAKKFFFSDAKTSKGVEGLDMIPYATSDKTGEPSLTAEIVERMVNDDVPYAADWAEYSRVSNAASMWYEGYANAIGTDGRLRCAFRQNGTRSTRFSVERVNLQAIPQDYRLSEYEALAGIPTPRQLIANAVPGGWRLFELDLEQAELRVGTMIAGCKLMEQMIRDGEDLHDFTTLALFPHVSKDDPLFKSKWRQVGKRGNFSLQFGAKGPTFRKMVSKETGIVLGDAEADRIVRDWNGLYPEFGRAIQKHQDKVVSRQNRFGHGWLSLINGERRWFQPYEEAHKAFNQRVQGNLAQFGIDWMRMTDEFLLGATKLHQQADNDRIGEPGLVLTIHDSQVLLLPDDAYGQYLADRCAGFGKDLWKQMFPGIPGGVDYHAWERTAA